MVMVLLDVNKDHFMSQENDKLLELVLKYHILAQLRTLLHFYICICWILFLSISINSKILEQIQGYNLHFRDTTISSNYMEVLALHDTSRKLRMCFCRGL
jgi:predicted glycosyltransferase involved in capsule biosynthesis